MEKMSQYTFIAGFVSIAVATVIYIVYAFAARRSVVAVGAGAGSGTQSVSSREGGLPELGGYATTMAALGFAFMTLSLISRALATGHGPFANMYEFSVAFAWGIVGVYLYFEQRYRTRALGAFVLPWALVLLYYASTVPSDVQPLVPALQNNLLLTIHVAIAILAYGTFAVSFGAAALYLVQVDSQIAWLPDAAILDEIGYRAVVIGFPAMALVIILGAVWADVAWGSYWSWAPKETASLITWLIYGGYLHARTMRGWRGRRSAWLLIIGFAATLVTYFGNLWFGGLHSYAGV
jgi:cytochrome c-type biogenesis protein CcsB